MKNSNEKGFSLIELLLVCVIIGIVAAVAVPNFMKGMRAAENGATVGVLRTIHSTQVSFYSQNNRFGRLAELNPMVGNGLGTLVDPKIFRGRATFEMSPGVPTDEELRTKYVISASVLHTDTLTYIYELSHVGVIEQVQP